MCGIFDYFQIILFCNIKNRIHIADKPADMHRYDCFDIAVFFHSRFYFFRIDIKRARININKQRVGTEIADNLGGGGECVWRGDDLVASANSGRLQRKMQTCRGGVDAYRMLCSGVSGKIILELFGFWPGGYPSAFYGLHHLVDLFITY